MVSLGSIEDLPLQILGLRKFLSLAHKCPLNRQNEKSSPNDIFENFDLLYRPIVNMPARIFYTETIFSQVSALQSKGAITDPTECSILRV